jgi:uncharacterized protein YjbI with pentapeptide repeats
MEVRRVEGNNLVKNVVYNIYKNEGNDNVGVCLVIGENNRNNRTIIRLRKLIGNDEISLIKSEIYGKKPVNLTGADLTHSNLTGAVLTDTKLNFSKLTGATLIDATLTDANLTGSNLTGANLTGANISFSNLTLSNLTGAILTRVNLYLTDLTDSNLTNANLTGATLTDATLTDAIISRNSLSESQTEEGTIFGQPKYIEDLSEEQLRQEQRRQEQRRREILRQQRINLNNNNNNRHSNRSNNRNRIVDGNELVQNCVYNIYKKDGNTNVGVCLVKSENNRNNRTRIKLRKLIENTQISLTKSEIYGKKPVNLTGADLTGIDLTRAVLTDAKLNFSKLTGATLIDANLTGVDLTGAVLNRNVSDKIKNVILTGADLTDANLTGAVLNRIISGKIKGNPILPSGYILINGYIIGQNAILTGADLTGADLTGADLNRIVSGKIKGEPILPSRYVLINGYIIGPNVNLVSDDLTNANLTGADLTGADLTAADLTGANLTNANLTDADLTGADLTRANLTRTDLTGADLNRIISGKIKGNPILHSRYVLINGFIIGPNVNLVSNDLTNANLTGADLTRANLTGANLTGADLIDADLTRANLTDAILTGADLTGADLTGANLTGAYLTDADLTRTDLTRTDLTDATIYSNELSEEQIRKIIGRPKYIEPYFNISKELSNGNRISKHNGKKLENTNTKTQHGISFTRLFDFLLQEENQEKIKRRFRIGGKKGEEGIDAGGPTRTIFQKCYEVFMERYFYPYEAEDNSNYVVLKDLSHEQFEQFEEFEKACKFMILLAKKVEGQSGQPFQILIPINFLLFQVLIFEGNPETFFELGNKNKFFGKRENGSYSNQHKLNNPYNFIAKNNTKNNNNQNKVSKFNKLEDVEQQKLMFLMLLEQNRIHRRSHYEIMKRFVDEIFKPNKKYFTIEIDYSYDAFVKRLKFQLSDESRNRNLQSFKSLEIARNPLIKLLLDYIKVSNDYRMVMTSYVCGSFCYAGDIKIVILTGPSNVPFQSHTCSNELWVYINPEVPRAFNWVLKQNINNKNNIFSPIEKLYNVFLDRTTQIM